MLWGLLCHLNTGAAVIAGKNVTENQYGMLISELFFLTEYLLKS